MKRIKPTDYQIDIESQVRATTDYPERAKALERHTKRIQAETKTGFDKGKIFIVPNSFSQLGEIYGCD